MAPPGRPVALPPHRCYWQSVPHVDVLFPAAVHCCQQASATDIVEPHALHTAVEEKPQVVRQLGVVSLLFWHSPQHPTIAQGVDVPHRVLQLLVVSVLMAHSCAPLMPAST